MATTAAVARNLLKSSKSFPQIIRGRILGRSNAAANLNNIAKDHHQIVQSLFVSNQTIHAQIPIFDFTEMGSLVGSHRALTLEEKVGGSHRIVVEARGKVVVDDDDEFVDDEDVEFDDDEEFDAKDDDDDDCDAAAAADDDGGN